MSAELALIVHALLGFSVVAALLTVIPGLDTAIVLRKAVTGSRHQAFAAAGGIQLGTMVWGVAAAAGVTALLAASTLAYRVLSLAGAAYLILLGVLLLTRSVRPGSAEEKQLVLRRDDNAWRSLAAGLGTNLLNPKVGVLYLATIPQFVPAGVSPLLMGVLLALVHCVLGSVWFTMIIFSGNRLGRRLKSTRFVRWIDRVTGGVLIVFGVKLVATSR